MIARNRVKIIVAVLLALVMSANFTALCFASDTSTSSNLDVYQVSAYVSLTDTGSSSWATFNVPHDNIEITLGDDGYWLIVIRNVSSLYSTGHVWRVQLDVCKYADLPSSSGSYGFGQIYNVSSFEVTSSFQGVANSGGAFSLTSSNLPSFISSPLGFASFYQNPNESDLMSNSGISRREEVTHLHFFDTPIRITRSINVLWSGFDAFGDVDLYIRLKVDINGDTVSLIRAGDKLSDLADDLSVPTPNIDVGSLVDNALSEADMESVGSAWSFMDNHIITTMLLITVTIALLGYILYGKKEAGGGSS